MGPAGPGDAAARDLPAVSGDVATLEWIRDRVAYTLDSVDVTRIDTLLEQLRANANDEDLPAAATTASALRQALARARPAPEAWAAFHHAVQRWVGVVSVAVG